MQTDSQTPEAPERRQWPRLPASMLGDVSASIVSGPQVKLVNISRGGALIEVPTRYPMRSWVRLRLTRATGDVTIAAGTVLWAQVASMVEGRINYLIAIAFETPIEDLPAATGIMESQAAPQASEHDAELARVQAETEQQRAEVEQLRAEAQHQRTEAERHRTEAERHRIEAERQRIEAERQRIEAERHRVELDARCRALQARITELESLCAAHEARSLTLRREAEKLAAAIAAPIQPEAAQAVA